MLGSFSKLFGDSAPDLQLPFRPFLHGKKLLVRLPARTAEGRQTRDHDQRHHEPSPQRRGLAFEIDGRKIHGNDIPSEQHPARQRLGASLIALAFPLAEDVLSEREEDKHDPTDTGRDDPRPLLVGAIDVGPCIGGMLRRGRRQFVQTLPAPAWALHRLIVVGIVHRLAFLQSREEGAQDEVLIGVLIRRGLGRAGHTCVRVCHARPLILRLAGLGGEESAAIVLHPLFHALLRGKPFHDVLNVMLEARVSSPGR